MRFMDRYKTMQSPFTHRLVLRNWLTTDVVVASSDGKLAMKHHEVDGFNHPNLSLTHPLSRHALYRLSRDEFLNKSC
jgi:hypothetical protein